jgi:hypothetical protein
MGKDEFPLTEQAKQLFHVCEDYWDKPMRARALDRKRQHEAMVKALAEEALPCAMPGTQWRMSHARPPRLEPFIGSYGRHDTRLDHLMVFRRQGMRGVTWDSAAVVAQPYMSAMRDETIAQMLQIFAQARIGIWSSAALSTHFPGWTALLICARGLYQRAPHPPFETMAETLEYWHAHKPPALEKHPDRGQHV